MNQDQPFSLPSQLASLTIGPSSGESENQNNKVPSTYREVRDITNLANSISIGVQNTYTYYGAQNEAITPIGKSIASMIEEIKLIVYQWLKEKNIQLFLQKILDLNTLAASITKWLQSFTPTWSLRKNPIALEFMARLELGKFSILVSFRNLESNSI
jgi:hypothetical protein